MQIKNTGPNYGALIVAKNGDRRIRVFVCYSHNDAYWIKRLRIHLASLPHDYDIDCWDDSKIRPGAKWRDEIRVAVEKANAAVLLISADFLASEFIRKNELPPLLKAAEDEGALILPLIVSPSLFMRKPELSQFQAVNDPLKPLVAASPGEQEEALVKIAEALIEKATAIRTLIDVGAGGAPASRREAFLEHSTWTRLIKIGDWIFDEEGERIIGSGMQAFLVSREEYGESPFDIQAKLEFTNFVRPEGNKLGMNAGIVFGFRHEQEVPQYFNVLISGSHILVERNNIDSSGRLKFTHLTQPTSLRIESGKSYNFKIEVGATKIEVIVDDKPVVGLDRPTGIVGRVGLRPWRSKLDCTEFSVTARQK
jgi:TIR domain